MRFQLFSLVFLGVLTSSFARPCFSSRDDIKARSNVDHEDVALFHRDTYKRDIINDRDTYPRSTFDPILARSVLQELLPRHKAYKPKTGNPLLYGKAPAQKKTAQDAKNRKEAVRKTVATNQQAKGAKRKEYANALEIAKSPARPTGFRVPKKPKKAPEANMQKGQAKSAKGAATQQAANDRKTLRKKPYRDAGAAYKKTKNLPGRPGNSEKGSKSYKGSKWTYNVPNARKWSFF